MGLDWIVMAKEEAGRTIEPWETAGRKLLHRSDPETVEAFRKIYDEYRIIAKDPGPKPVLAAAPRGVAGLIDRLTGRARSRRRDYEKELERWQQFKDSFERWNRPFEVVLEEFAAQDPPPVVIKAADDCQDALGKFLGIVCSSYDFRGGVLSNEQNSVSYYALNALGMDFGDMLYLDRTPEEMMELADDVEKALAAYRASDEEQDEDSIEVAEAAIPWLRFWASKGHSIAADF